VANLLRANSPGTLQSGRVSKHEESSSTSSEMKKTSAISICASVLCLMPACSERAPLSKVSPQVRVAFETVQNPAQELCTNDTLSRTDWVNVPLVRFAGSTIELNGALSSEHELLDWAQKKYRNMAEQALWVQISPEDRPAAERALLPLIQSLPNLHLRLVDDPSFTCQRQQKNK
jgi:hypothetical protein